MKMCVFVAVQAVQAVRVTIMQFRFVGFQEF